MRSRLLVIRHAKAGDPERWSGDDRQRPLTRKGRHQADGLVGLLGAVPLTEIRSSPYLRCRQTVEPLARARSLPVIDDGDLAVGGSLDQLLDRAAEAAGACWAACTHGDLLAELVRRLVETGAVAGDQAAFQKGATWIVEVERSGIAAARYLPPPAGRTSGGKE